MFHASSSPRWWRPSSGRPATSRAWAIPGRRRSPVRGGEGDLGVRVPLPEGVLRTRRPALAGELVTVVVAPTGPGQPPRTVLGGQHPAGLGERQAAVHLRLGQPGQLRAERADLRARGPDQQPVLGEPFARAQVDDGETDLDDLAHLAGRRLPLPAGRLDIDDVQQMFALLPHVHHVHGASVEAAAAPGHPGFTTSHRLSRLLRGRPRRRGRPGPPGPPGSPWSGRGGRRSRT